MDKVRIRYLKTGRAKYLSHLDLMATMQRSFIRSEIKLKYSKGFNPHPYMSVALPLSVGLESLCELIDVGIVDNNLIDIKNIKTPDGIKLLEAYIPNRKFSEITWIEINARLYYDKQPSLEAVNKLKCALTKKSIIIIKKTKRGLKELDVAPYIKDVELSFEDALVLKAKVSAQNPTINADDIVNACGELLKPEYIDFKRVEIYDSSMVIFR